MEYYFSAIHIYFLFILAANVYILFIVSKNIFSYSVISKKNPLKERLDNFEFRALCEYWLCSN